MTQLLIQTTAPDCAAWKTAFDADAEAEAENIAAASLAPKAIASACAASRRMGPGMGSLALALTIGLTTQATAQIVPTGTPAADILLTTALAEHQVFLTCSSLEPQTYGQIAKNWQRDVAAAMVILVEQKVAPEAIAAFQSAARIETLLPVAGTPYAEVKEFCDAYPDWMTDYYQFNLTVLELKLPAAFQ
jgi:hypothetical protein